MERGSLQPVVFSGLDEISAALTPLLSSPVLLALGAFAYPQIGLGPVVALSAAVLMLLASKCYRLTISSEGIELAELWGWIVPTKRIRYPLDASIEIYESFEADAPEGLCIEPRFGWGHHASECFGPHFSQQRIAQLREQATEALARFRAASSSSGRTLRFANAPGLEQAFETLGREFWTGGRLRSARLNREVEVGGMRLPAGTIVECNTDGYLDPRMPDLLQAATLSAPSALPLSESPVAIAGCRISFDSKGRASFAKAPFVASATVQGVVVDGTEGLGWDAAGKLDRFTLGAPRRVGACELSAGSRFMPWGNFLRKGPPDWYVHPGAPVVLPQFTVTPSQTLIVAADFSRIISAMTAGDLTIEGTVVRGGVLHFPLDASLFVDLRACRKMGLLK